MSYPARAEGLVNMVPRSNNLRLILREKLFLKIVHYTYIYIYIYILLSTDRLFCCITTRQCGYTPRTLEPGIAQPAGDIRQLGKYKTLCGSFRLLTFCLTGYQISQFFSFAFREWQPLIPSPECSTPWRWELIHCHPQTVSLYHNSSVWLDT